MGSQVPLPDVPVYVMVITMVFVQEVESPVIHRTGEEFGSLFVDMAIPYVRFNRKTGKDPAVSVEIEAPEFPVFYEIDLSGFIVQYHASHIEGGVIVLAELVNGQRVGACFGEIGYLPFFPGLNVQRPDVITAVNGTDKDHPLVIGQDAVAGKVQNHVVIFTAGEPFYFPHEIPPVRIEIILPYEYWIVYNHF
jgi:hypothetical protein